MFDFPEGIPQCVELTNFISGTKLKCPVPPQIRYVEAPSKITHTLVWKKGPFPSKDYVFNEAKIFLHQYASEKGLPNIDQRLSEIRRQIEETGTYIHTFEELQFGAKVAWRNSSRCIGRLFWNKLEVIDRRNIDCNNAQEIFRCCLDHLKIATNGGNIVPVITIFKQRTPENMGPKIFNSQLIRYAGYRQKDGSYIGDPINADFTEFVKKLGWKGAGSPFDVLPLAIKPANSEHVQLFEIPKEYVLEVPISHPQHPWWEELGYKWYAVPAISNFVLEIGGVEYPCAPFNGWYMETEIGRDLGEEVRYNALPILAEKLNFDTKTPLSLWKDRTWVELNYAILYSFQKHKVTLMDHHTASSTFILFFQKEIEMGRGVPGDWIWLVPPISGSLSPVFHQEMMNWFAKPNFFNLEQPPWTDYVFPEGVVSSEESPTITKINKNSEISRSSGISNRKMRKLTILYATETGNSENFAKQLSRLLGQYFKVKVVNIQDYDYETELCQENLVLFCVSTFGNGSCPTTAEEFVQWLKKPTHPAKYLQHLHYAVFGLGSSLYTNFCACGKFVDSRLSQLGASRIIPLGEGDEIQGQQSIFNEWTKKLINELKTIGLISDVPNAVVEENNEAKRSEDSNVIFRLLTKKESIQIMSGTLNRQFTRTKIGYGERNNPFFATVIENVELHTPKSERSTRFISFDITDAPECIRSYKPGDHVGVWPINSKTMIEKLAQRIGINDLSQSFTFEFSNVKEKKSKKNTKTIMKPVGFPIPSTFFETLERFLDITTPPSPQLLMLFANYTKNEEERKELIELSSNKIKYQQWLSYHLPTLVEVLEMFPGVNVPVDVLFKSLPVLKPRFYSISSSPHADPQKLSITVAVVRWKRENGKERIGLTSNYLTNISPGSKETVRIFVNSAPHFRLPTNSTTPIVMIGPGTGIAPFRSMWRERAATVSDPSQLGVSLLFFGCRKRDEDFLYEKELKEFVATKKLTEVIVAFSREQKEKVYVQHKMIEKSAELWNLIDKEGAYFYICGDIQMVKSVRQVFKEIVIKHGKFTDDEAETYIQKLQQSNRYAEDSFGYTLYVTQNWKTTEEKKEISDTLKRQSDVMSNLSTSNMMRENNNTHKHKHKDKSLMRRKRSPSSPSEFRVSLPKVDFSSVNPGAHSSSPTLPAIATNNTDSSSNDTNQQNVKNDSTHKLKRTSRNDETKHSLSLSSSPSSAVNHTKQNTFWFFKNIGSLSLKKKNKEKKEKNTEKSN